MQINRAETILQISKKFHHLYGLPGKKLNRRSAFLSKVYGNFKNEITETDYNPPGLHTGTGAVERAIQRLKKLIRANLEDKIGFTEIAN